METTRRTALLLAGYAAASVMRAGDAENGLAVSNSRGLTIAPFGDQTVPSFTVSLPGQERHPAIVVEMPEHAWHRRTKADEPEWFYRRYTNDPRVQGTAAWTRQNNELRYRMTVPSAFEIQGRVTLVDDGVEIEYEIKNPGNVDYVEVQAITCVKLYRPFTDVFLERTYVHHSEGLDLLASDTPERLARNAEEWLPRAISLGLAAVVDPHQSPSRSVRMGSLITTNSGWRTRLSLPRNRARRGGLRRLTRRMALISGPTRRGHVTTRITGRRCPRTRPPA